MVPTGGARTAILALGGIGGAGRRFGSPFPSCRSRWSGYDDRIRHIGGRGAKWSAGAWISAKPIDLRLQPGDKKNLRINVSVPKAMPDGSHHAALLGESERQSPNKSGVTVGIPTPVVVQVGRTTTRKARLQSPGIVLPSEGPGILTGGRLVNEGITRLRISERVVVQRRSIVPELSGPVQYIGEGRFEDVAGRNWAGVELGSMGGLTLGYQADVDEDGSIGARGALPRLGGVRYLLVERKDIKGEGRYSVGLGATF